MAPCPIQIFGAVLFVSVGLSDSARLNIHSNRSQLRSALHDHEKFSRVFSVPRRNYSCIGDQDCGWHARCDPEIHECASLSIGADIRADVLMGVLGFIIAAISLAAGVGGGGLNVPILMLVISFDAHVATAMSQAMLTGGALAAFIYNYTGSHPNRPRRPLINFELASLMGTGVVSGAQIGSVIHATAPPALILLLLCLVLLQATKKGISNAMAILEQESQEKPKEKEQTEAAGEDDPHAEMVLERSHVARRNLTLFFVLVVALTVSKNYLFMICSPMWWTMTVVGLVVLGGFTYWIAKDLSAKHQADNDDLNFKELAFPLATYCVLAGCLGALCGIGGGMVIGPMLTAKDPETGRPTVMPSIAAATTATTLLVLASSTTVVYVCRGTIPIRYALMLSMCTFLGAGTGKVVIGRWIKKTGKQSVIVFMLAGITAVSLLLMASQGVLTVMHDGWHSFCFRSLCVGAQSDVSPQDQVQLEAD